MNICLTNIFPINFQLRTEDYCEVEFTSGKKETSI